MYEVVFWGGPKDGRVERFDGLPLEEIYCLDDDSPLLGLFEVYQAMRISEGKKYCRYRAEQISKKKYQYVYNGIL